jgi:hemolysin III
MTESALVAAPPKPLLRGVSHEVAFFVTLVAGGVLLAHAPNRAAMVGLGVYIASLATQFGVSALYHRPTWGPTGRRVMRRFDHAAIFVLIAGTATPFALTLPHQASLNFLGVLWAGAAVGVLRALFWIDAPKVLVAVLAVALGLANLFFVPALQAVAGPLAVWLIVAGGVFYITGAVVYATKKPNPWPTVFGYHEIFHALVIVAAVCHFVAISSVLHAIGA